jgi:cephalosporin hydroxylase
MDNDPRSFASAIPSEVWDSVQHGTMRTLYRGVPFYKSPFDIALYLQLIGRVRPSTIIEVGTKYGGSALWFAGLRTCRPTMA